MPQQKGQAEINSFVGGLVTDASPLTFPENTSKVDVNMDLLTDGSRKRALGIDCEDDFQVITTTTVNAGSEIVGIRTFRWENVAGDSAKNILCVQTGNEVRFLDLSIQPLSSAHFATKTFSGDPTKKFSFTTVDGDLVVADGTNIITIVSYNSDNTLSYSESKIKVRDLFGVEDVVDGIDLTTGQGLATYPSTSTNQHIYNLRNQGFSIPRIAVNTNNLLDPIVVFNDEYRFRKGFAAFPSNSDTVSAHLYPNASHADDKVSDRYFANDAVSNPLGTMRASQGYHVIDLLNRGSSRLEQDVINRSNYPELAYTVSSLPEDRTPGGATVVAEFSGRVWYGGFSGEVIDGDSKSPKLSSYVAFSQLVKDPSLITSCYQEGDPTSTESPDLIDTDGGLIRISNSYEIKAMINLGSDLMVGASNGWWRIYGGNDSGFSGTNYVVSKLTERGVTGVDSVVETEGSIMYWSNDGIYHIRKNQFGDWEAVSLTVNRIQTFYNDLSTLDKQSVVGNYDSYQKKVRWLYRNSLINPEAQKELVYSLPLNAFWERHISQLISSGVPILTASYIANPYTLEVSVEPVTSSGNIVTSNSENVTVSIANPSADTSLNEMGYVIVTRVTPTIQFTFGAYKNTSYLDWELIDGIGVDSPATLVTGDSSAGDNIKYKNMPYAIVHMKRTEDGFELDTNGDFVPINQSGCKMQVQWDWTNSSNSGKWSQPIQVYRYKRAYFPSDVSSTFDTGYETVVTKNKLRGRGRSLKLKFESEEGKEMHLYGWSLVLLGNSNE